MQIQVAYIRRLKHRDKYSTRMNIRTSHSATEESMVLSKYH